MKATVALLACMSVVQLNAVLGSTAVGGVAADNVHLWIELPKSEYAVCEDISLYLFVTNEGSQPTWIPEIDRFGHSGFEVSLHDSAGQKMPYTGLIGYPASAQAQAGSTVQPGDTVLFCIDLLEGFATGGWHTRYPRHLPCGRYQVDGNLDGALESNRLLFTVNRLDPMDDSLAAEYWALVTGTTDRAYEVSSLADMLHHSPDSPVSSRICRDLVGRTAADSVFSDANIEYRKFMVQHYPEHGSFAGNVYVLLRELSTEEFLESFSGDAAFKRSRIASFMFRQELKKRGRSDVLLEVMGQ